MNDLIINDLYEIRNYLDQVIDYIKKIKDKLLEDSFIQTRQHLYEIYNDRFEYSIYSGRYFEGLPEVVKRMNYSDLKNVRLSAIDGAKKSCFIFSSEDYSIILGMIFYDN